MLNQAKPRGGWREFLKTTAAAPVLRQALEVLPATSLHHLALRINKSLRGTLATVYDR